MIADDESPQKPKHLRRLGVIGRWTHRRAAMWRPILLTLLLVGTTGYAVGYFYFVYRADLRTNDAVTRQVVKAASDGTVALLSYSPETLERDFANARSRITDDYLTYYQRFTDQIVGPSAQRGQVTTTATVVKAAVSELHPNSAVVLLFVRQQTASKEKPQPVVTSSSLRLEMVATNGSWLIEKLETIEPPPAKR